MITAIGSAALAVAVPVSVNIAEYSTTIFTGGIGIRFEGKGSGGNVADGGNGGNTCKGDGGNGGAGGGGGGAYLPCFDLIVTDQDRIRGLSTHLTARKFDLISGGPAISFGGNSHGGDVGDADNGGNGGSSVISTGR